MLLIIIIIFIILLCILNGYYNDSKYLFTKHENIINKQEKEKINKMTKIMILRGLVAPNCYWWDISDQQDDKSGILEYNKLVKRYNKPFIPMEMLGQKLFLITEPKFIEIVLNNSPHIFSVNKLKYTFFKSFMKYNVGVSTRCPWIKRRMINEKTLSTDNIHPYGKIFNKYIHDIIISNKIPTKFDDFIRLSQKITTKIVFNRDNIAQPIFKFLSIANSFDPFTQKKLQFNEKHYNSYFKYMEDNIINTNKNSLLYIATRYNKDVIELSHQIPHWVFPIASSVHTTSTRLLLLLCNHKIKFGKVINEINNVYSENDWKSIYRLQYLRKCILEVLRLNNNVVSMFRTLTKNFKFNNEYYFKKGTQFAIFTNPILRNKRFFKYPDKFIPERWTKELELKYSPSISFSRGPQKCPGKDIALFITASFIVHFLKKCQLTYPHRVNNIKTKIINTENIDHAINPCKISFQIQIC